MTSNPSIPGMRQSSEQVEGRLRGERAFKHLHGLFSARLPPRWRPSKEAFPAESNGLSGNHPTTRQRTHTLRFRAPAPSRAPAQHAQPNDAMERASLAEGARPKSFRP